MTTPGWLNPVPSGDVGHGQLPGDPQQWAVLSEDQLQQMRKQLLESIIASVVQAVQGLFVPGPFGSANEQLEQWAGGIQQQIMDNLAEAQQNWEDFTEQLSNFLQLDKWQEFLDGVWADAQQAIDNILDDLVNFLRLDEWQAYLDNLWLNLTGVKPDTTITANDATDQFALLMATTAAQATTIAQLQAAINKPPNGLVGGDDFERPNAASLGTGWKIYSENSNGEFTVVNGQAVWKREGILANTVRCIRIDPKDAKTNTPYQTVTRVTGTTVLQTIALGESAEDIVYARVSDDHKAYMLAWWDVGVDGKGRLHLAYNLGSGGDKEVEVVPCDKPSPGVPLTLSCGDSTSLYSYRVIRGNTVLIEWDDPNRLTTPLINNRGWGFGGRAQFGAFGQFGPSAAHSVTVADTRDL